MTRRPVWFIVDQLSLYREMGSAAVMTAQLRHLVDIASLPHISLTVMPARAPILPTSSEFIIADDAAYTERAAGGPWVSVPKLERRV